MSIPTIVNIVANDAHTVRIRFDQQLDRDSTPDASAFVVIGDAVPTISPTVVTIIGTDIYLTISDLTAYVGLGWPKLAYTPTGDPIQNSDAEAAVGFAATAFGNFSTAYAAI